VVVKLPGGPVLPQSVVLYVGCVAAQDNLVLRAVAPTSSI
jgi:tartrate dehydratase beta subunit/fumarate hydratase class I family protein